MILSVPAAVLPRVEGLSPDTRLKRWIFWVLVCVIYLQRVALPLWGGKTLPILAILIPLATWYAITHQILEVRADRTFLYLAAIGSILAGSIVALSGGLSVSMASVAFFCLLYSTFMASAPQNQSLLGYQEARAVFVKLMKPVAVIALVQFSLQSAGIQYFDVLDKVLPRDLLISGYNTSYPLDYFSTIYRSNGVFLLEPSFLSQFCALALLGTFLIRGKPSWATRGWQLIFFLAMLSSLSGTGILLLGFGLILLAVTGRGRLVAAVLCVGTGILALLFATGALDLFVARLTLDPSSSTNLRFIDPWVRLVAYPLDTGSPLHLLFGNGAGQADVTNVVVNGLQAPAIAKVFFEYGLVGLGVVGLFFFKGIRGSMDRLPWAGPVVFMYLFLSGSLLQPATVFLVLVLVVLWPSEQSPRMTSSK